VAHVVEPRPSMPPYHRGVIASHGPLCSAECSAIGIIIVNIYSEADIVLLCTRQGVVGQALTACARACVESPSLQGQSRKRLSPRDLHTLRK